LCELPIKAACPTEVCVRCGMPRQRITRTVGYAGRMRTDDGHPRHTPGFRERERRSPWGERPIRITTGWTACACRAGFRPGIVFDPFAGAGTTLVVAKKLGKLYLGCELNPAYVKLARERLARVPPLRGPASRHHNSQRRQGKHKSMSPITSVYGPERVRVR